MNRLHSGVEIEATYGNIADQPDIQAIVNAANAELQYGGGVAGAIHNAAGPGLAQECRPLAPIKPGQAVITGAHNLPNDYVIHCLGPVYGHDKPEDELLAACYLNALRLAENNNIESVAFSAISAGAFGYPFVEATNITLTAIKEILPSLKKVQRIRFVLFRPQDMDIFESRLEAYFAG